MAEVPKKRRVGSQGQSIEVIARRRTKYTKGLRESGFHGPGPFVSRSAAVSKIETEALREWHDFLDDLETRDDKIFRPQSGFFPFASNRRSSTLLALKPAKWFKNIKRSLMSQVTQLCTNHAPTGEYFKRCVWKYKDQPETFFQCGCKNTPHNYPPVLQTRDHIIRACPLFDKARDRLRKVFPRIDNPRVSLSKLVRKQTIEHVEQAQFYSSLLPYCPTLTLR